MANLFRPVDPTGVSGGLKGLAKIYEPGSSSVGGVDVINDYTWTLTPREKRKEIPSIILTEYQINENTVDRQIAFYAQGMSQSIEQNANFLSPYKELFPRDRPTGFWYMLPFYSDINFELSTPEWASLDTLEHAKKGATDTIGLLFGNRVAGFVEKGLDFAGSAFMAGLAMRYPKVGIMDRPKLWSSHNFRTYTVRFPLYNTVNTDPDDSKPEWVKNRELCELLINQNLYNKRDFITGIPPVFYEVLIPGQHYSPAAAVTNIVVNNRGNIRQISPTGNTDVNQTYNVPDVYDISITLMDLVIPSKNLFQAIQNQAVRSSLRPGPQT